MTTIINFLFVYSYTRRLTHSRRSTSVSCFDEILEEEWVWELDSNVKSFCRYCCLVVYTQNVKWSGRGFFTWKPYLEWKRGLLEQSMSTGSLFIQTGYNFGWRRCYVYPRFIRPGTDGSQHCRFVYTYLEVKFPSKRFLLCIIRVRGTDVRWHTLTVLARHVRWNRCDLF